MLVRQLLANRSKQPSAIDAPPLVDIDHVLFFRRSCHVGIARQR